jgi:hypothetical protein
MHNRRMPTASWTLAAAIVAVLTLSANGQQTSTAIDRLGTDNLGQTMIELRMGKLLDAAAEESGDRNLQISALIFQAENAREEQRDDLLARAADLMKEQVEVLENRLPTLKDRDPDAWEKALVDYFRLRLRYIETQYLTRGEPYVARFNLLLGGPADRAFLAELTDDVRDEMGRMERSLQRALEDYRTDLMYVVTLMPHLQSFDRQLQYKGAFVYYTAAMALPAHEQGTGRNAANAEIHPQRKEFLEKAISRIDPYANPTDPSYEGWEPYARLLQGRCYRELEEFEQAEKLLQQCATQQQESAVVNDALFELSRNKAEWGAKLYRGEKPQDEADLKFKSAVAAIDSAVKAMREDGNELAADVRRLILQAHIYDLWAESLEPIGQKGEAAEKARLAHDAFVVFLQKYPDHETRLGLYSLMAPKFADVEDYSTLNPVILLVLGMGRFQEARQTQDPAQLDDLRRLFESIIESDDPAAEPVQADALWYLGQIYNEQTQLFAAVDAFRQLANEHTDHPLAYLAAQNAVGLMYQDIESLIARNQPIAPAKRMKLVEALELILKHWPDKPGAIERHFDLAWQASRLAESAETEAQAEQWRAKAVASFQQVPTDDELYPWAKGLGLELEARRVLRAEDAGFRKAEGPGLYRRLREYAEEIRQQLPAMDPEDPQRRNRMQTAAENELLAQEIRYEILGEKGSAIAAIENLGQRWPDADAVLRDGQEYLIRTFVEDGNVAGAVKQLREFEAKYGQAEAEGLMAVVIDGLSGRIQDLLAAGDASQELEQYRKAYVDFARKYYDQRKDTRNADEKYQITLLLADALIQSGEKADAQQAMDFFRELKSIEEARHDRARKRIDEKFKALKAKVQRAGDVISAIKLLHEDWQDAIEAYDAGDWARRSGAAAMIRHAWAMLQAAQAGEETTMSAQEAAERLRDAIARGYDDLQAYAKKSFSQNATLVLGMAHAHRRLGQHDEAVTFYRQVINGLSPEASRNMYGEAQLGYVQSLFEINRDNAQQLEHLDEHIERLREIAPNFWNRERFLPRFNRIQAQIRNRLREID